MFQTMGHSAVDTTISLNESVSPVSVLIYFLVSQRGQYPHQELAGPDWLIE